MTLVVTSNVVGQRRGVPVVLPNRRRRLSTVVARHRPPAGRRFIVSVHRRGDEHFAVNDRAVKLRADWKRTLVGPNDVVLITVVPLGRGIASIGLALAAIALVVVAGPAGAAFGAGLGAAIGIPTAAAGFAIQAGPALGSTALLSISRRSLAALAEGSPSHDSPELLRHSGCDPHLHRRCGLPG